MKVLLTGSTASHVSAKKNLSTPTFSGLVHRALTQAKHDVTWIDPSVSLTKDYLAEFDSVVVGLAPPNSTAAHRIYGALSIINYARQLGTLKLLIDAPEPDRVWAGIRAIYNKPQELTKEFYEKRREYKKTVNDEVFEHLIDSINFLYTSKWPKTVFPSLPWMSFPSVSTFIPMTDSSNLVGINLDSFLINDEMQTSIPNESDYWVSDSPSSKWTRQIEKTIFNKVVPARTSRWEDNESVRLRVSQSIGSLISVYRRGAPWWSPVLAQSMCLQVPVVTDWTLSSMLGPSWSMLAKSVEEMSPEERLVLSENQKISYLAAVPTQDESVELTCNALLK